VGSVLGAKSPCPAARENSSAQPHSIGRRGPNARRVNGPERRRCLPPPSVFGRRLTNEGVTLVAQKRLFEIAWRSTLRVTSRDPKRRDCSSPRWIGRTIWIPMLDRPTPTLPLEPISVSGLFCSIAADRHAAPPARVMPGSIDKDQCAGWSLASFHVGEVLCAGEVRQ
jgi:hypothetical protein